MIWLKILPLKILLLLLSCFNHFSPRSTRKIHARLKHSPQGFGIEASLKLLTTAFINTVTAHPNEREVKDEDEAAAFPH